MNAEELARLVVRIVGDASSYLSMIAQVEIKTKGVVSSISGMVSKLMGVQKAIGGVANQALGYLGRFGLISSFMGAFNKFEQLENIMIGLTAAIKANGGSVDETMQSYSAFVKKIGEVTTLSKTSTFGLLEQAEARGFTGKAAEQIVTNAIAMAKGNDQLASSYIRVAEMMQRGHPEFARRILGLQGVKNGTELLNAIQKRLQTGMDIGIAKAANVTGEMTKLKRTFDDLTRDIGGMIAEVIGPFVHALTLVGNAFKDLSPESKKLVAYIVLGTMAFLALAPTIAAISFFFGPLISLISALASAIIFLVTSPVSLFIAGIAAMVASMLYFTGQGGELLSWFGKQWDGLVEDVKIAVGGIADAIKAGDIELAWKILWASVKLIWAKSTQDLKELWIGFKLWFKETSIEMGAYLEELGRRATKGFADAIVTAWEKLGVVTKEEAEHVRNLNNIFLQGDLEDLAKDKKRMLNEAREQGMKEQKAIQDEINGLKKTRDGLVKEAREKAGAVKLPEFKVPKLPPMKQDVKLIPKFDAAAFASAEAISRIQAFKDKLEIQLMQKEGESPSSEKKFDAAAAGGAEARARGEGAETILKEIRDILKGDSKKPGIPLVPAGLGP